MPARQVEFSVVRSIPELSEEFCIELSTDPKSGADVCTIVVECLKNEETSKVTSKMEAELRTEYKITPVKAKRVVDKRGKKG